jgi:hypothetical protein
MFCTSVQPPPAAACAGVPYAARAGWNRGVPRPCCIRRLACPTLRGLMRWARAGGPAGSLYEDLGHAEAVQVIEARGSRDSLRQP